MIEWSFKPEIVTLGPIVLRWYSLLFMFAFLFGFFIMQWIYKKEGYKPERVDELFMIMFLSTIIGARLGHCFFYDPSYFLSHPLEILMIWKGGLASHGAAIGILTGLYYYSKKNPDLSYAWIIDRIVIVVALSGFFIRMGNLFNSEIIGIPTNSDWGFIFTNVDSIPRHPTQLYEAIAYLIFFFVLFFIYNKNKGKLSDWLLTGLFFLMVFGFRFFVEFYKENQSGFEQGMLLNMGQLLSIPLAIAGLILVILSISKTRKKKLIE
jgi:phosphatidylglycerol---prolipoprotein diacylglyceryl transferase